MVCDLKSFSLFLLMFLHCWEN